MSILVWVVVGVVIGVVSRFLDTKEAKGGLLGAVLFGIAGSVAGGFLATLIFGGGLGQIDVSSFLVVFSCSLFLLMVQRTIFSEEERF